MSYYQHNDDAPLHYCVECADHYGVAAFETSRGYEFQRCDVCQGFENDDDAAEWLAYLLNAGILALAPGPNFDEMPAVPVLE